jgi:protein phosphatase
VTRFDQIEHACLTDVGVRRSHNQDNYAVHLAGDEEGWQQRGHLFLVADGMGAHAVGEKASELAAQIILHIYQKHAQFGAPQALRRAFGDANAAIHTCGEQNCEFVGMGTTATVLLLRRDGAWVGHVGDSRCYRIRDEVIEQLSYDHSLLWEYARIQHLDPDEVEDIPTNVIHRCLGPEPLVQVDVEGPHAILPGDVYLLCSDGLSGQVTDEEMGAVASVLSPAEACRFLVGLSNLRGGPDNITVIVVRVGGEGSRGFRASGSLETRRSVQVRRSASPLTSAPTWPFREGPVESRFSLPDWSDCPATEGAEVAVRPRRGEPLLLRARWLLILVGGFLMLVCRSYLDITGWQDIAWGVFLLALLGFVTGIVGLIVYNLRGENVADSDRDRPPARAYRRRDCKIERPLLDKMVRAVRTLRRRAEENNWGLDWNRCEEHQALADNLLASNDLPGAFREYCRAMLLLIAVRPRQE